MWRRRAKCMTWPRRVIAQKISQVDGVGNVIVGGSSLPAVRRRWTCRALTRAGLTLEDVRTAIASGERKPAQGSDRRRATAAGRWWPAISFQGRRIQAGHHALQEWRGYAARRCRRRDRRTCRTRSTTARTNGRPSVTLVVFRQPGANIIEVVDHIKAMMPHLRAILPATMNFDIAMERTVTIRASVADVQRSLLLSVMLVMLVVFLFLRQLPRHAHSGRGGAGVAHRHVWRDVLAATASTISRSWR